MTDPQDGAPVEWEGVKRYEAFGVLFNYDDHQPVQPEVNRCTVVLASDHDAAVQRLSEQLAEAKRECQALHDAEDILASDMAMMEVERDEAKRENERLDAIAKDWYKHPAAQAEIGAKARLHIEIGLVDDLLKGEDDFSAMEMEYWTDTHDKLHALIKERDSLSTALAAAKRDLRHRDELDDFAKPLSCETHGLVPNLASFDNKCPQCALAAERERCGRMEAALAEAAEQLRMGAYYAGELGMQWSATTVTSECQKIKRKLTEAHYEARVATETKP